MANFSPRYGTENRSEANTKARNAVAVMNAWLSRERALEIVTVQPMELLAWMEARDLPNTSKTRRLYVVVAGHSHGGMSW